MISRVRFPILAMALAVLMTSGVLAHVTAEEE